MAESQFTGTITADQIRTGTIGPVTKHVPQPGEIWTVQVMGCSIEDVFVQKKSRLCSWLFGRPQYWGCCKGSRISWMEDEDVFLWCQYSHQGKP